VILSLEHQGRELLHVISLLDRCLQIPGTAPATRRKWRSTIFQTREKLASLYAAGLSPTFLSRKGLMPWRAAPPGVGRGGGEPG
jgi:hypothetical protein